MNKYPKISIIIPSLNKKRFIGKTLDSIFFQQYPNLEVVIQDGGSTDGTVGIVKKFAKKFPKIKWESKKDKGQTDAINKGLLRASGDVLTYINADDVYEEGALKAVGEYFIKNPDTLWLAGKGRAIDGQGKEISDWVTKYKNFLLGINSYQLLIVVNYLFQPSVFLSSLAYEKYGPFTGTQTSVMEYDLWLKIGRKQMPAVLKRDLSSFRISQGSISTSSFKITLKSDEKIVKKYTTNPFLLTLHHLHNVARVLIVRFL